MTDEEFQKKLKAIEEDREPWWARPFSAFGRFLFRLFHITSCLWCMIRYRSDERRVAAYEYYTPWGWGKASTMIPLLFGIDRGYFNDGN